MKYIITESRLNSIIFKYLNNIDWEITDLDDPEWGNMTRLFFKNESQFPEDTIFEAYDAYSSDESENERVLLVNRQFYLQLMNLFGLTNIETHRILIEWYENYTEETIDDKSLGFID
jgi:hypothetical protein